MGNALRFDFNREKPVQKQMPAGHRATVIQFPGTVRTVPEPVAVEAPKRRKRGASTAEDQRLAMLGKIHIALADLYERAKTDPNLAGFCEDVYRFKLQEEYGCESAAVLENWQLHNVLLWLSNLGWKARKGRHRKAAPKALTHDTTGMSRESRMEKIEAMLAEKGRAENTDVPWGYAVAILKRQTAKAPAGQVKNFDDATPQQLDDVIAALYKDAKRRGRRVR